jgi:hypothetical protein
VDERGVTTDPHVVRPCPVDAPHRIRRANVERGPRNSIVVDDGSSIGDGIDVVRSGPSDVVKVVTRQLERARPAVQLT